MTLVAEESCSDDDDDDDDDDVVAGLCYPVALHLGAVESRGSAREAFFPPPPRAA